MTPRDLAALVHREPAVLGPVAEKCVGCPRHSGPVIEALVVWEDATAADLAARVPRPALRQLRRSAAARLRRAVLRVLLQHAGGCPGR